MEIKITTNFEAKTEQKIKYPADFGGLPHAVENFFGLGPILCVWSGENCRYVVGGAYMLPPPA